ncbi:hypothetical protein HG530_003670 [Fusarium avenaceum]|nr:hypothetical protein HG530_003670 [Fusarium avenaceum]
MNYHRESNQRTLDNILVNTNTPDTLLATDRLALNVRRSLHAASFTDSVLLVVVDIELNVDLLKSSNHTRDRSVTSATQLEFLAIRLNNTLEDTDKILGILSSALGCRRGRSRSVRGNAVVDQAEVGVVGEELTSDMLAVLLDNLGEGDLETAG